MKKKALLSSILTIALCLSLIAGSTFALFTSESKVNVAVTSGKVDVVATIENLELYSPTTIGENGNIVDATNAADTTFKNGGTASLVENKLTLTNITPGDKVLFDVKITNNSNVTVQYRNIVEKIADNGLWAGLKVSIDGTEYNGEIKKSDWTVLNVGSDVITVPVVIELPATAGNAYQEKSCELAYTVEAVQGNAEMPDEWDGSSETPDLSGADVHITTAAQFAYLMEQTSAGNTNSWGYDKTFILDCDIDFGGATITGLGSDNDNISLAFDGNGHTIKNFVINNSREWYTGLFNQLGPRGSVKNLTVENATVIGNRMVGVIASNAEGDSVVENCHVKNCTVVSNKKKAGAVVGYTSDGTVTNCSATDCTVICKDADAAESNEIVGFINLGSTVENNTFTNVVVKRGVDLVISTAEELIAFAAEVNNYTSYAGKTVVLANDIDLNNIAWTPIGKVTESQNNPYFRGTFDGMGHTIYNLHVDKNDTNDELGYTTAGLFGWVDAAGCTIKNLNLDGATVKGNHYTGTLAGYFTGVIENCSVVNSTVVSVAHDTDNDGDKVGGLVGYVNANGIVKNSSVSASTVIGKRDVGGLIGCTYNNTCTVTGNAVSDTAVYYNTQNGGEVVGRVNGCNISDNTMNNVTVTANATAVSNAAELTSAMHKGGNILLLNDISVESWTSVRVDTAGAYSQIANSISIDGNNHSISGLTAPLLGWNPAQNVEIKNLTIKDSNIVSNETGNNANCGAFAAFLDDFVLSFKMSNCHAINVNVTANNSGALGAGALVGFQGMTTGDKVFSIVDCTVTGGSVTNTNGNAAGIVGMCYTNGNVATISGCEVDGVAITGEATNKQGAIVGTVCNGGGALEIANCTYTGNVYGRAVNATVNVQ